MSTFDDSSDLVIREILLNIENDDDLAKAIVLNKHSYDVTRSARFWQERLQKYYPDFVKDKKDFPNLSDLEYYTIISLFHSFKPTPGNYGSPMTEIVPANIRDQFGDEDNFNAFNIYMPYKDVDNPEIEEEYSEDPGFNVIYDDPNASYNFKQAERLGKFLYNNWNKLNKEKLFSERFITRLLLKGRYARLFDSFIYSKVIEHMLQPFEDSFEFNYDDNKYFSSETRLIFKLNDPDKQSSGIFTYINENIFP